MLPRACTPRHTPYRKRYAPFTALPEASLRIRRDIPGKGSLQHPVAKVKRIAYFPAHGACRTMHCAARSYGVPPASLPGPDLLVYPGSSARAKSSQVRCGTEGWSASLATAWVQTAQGNVARLGDCCGVCFANAGPHARRPPPAGPPKPSRSTCAPYISARAESRAWPAGRRRLGSDPRGLGCFRRRSNRGNRGGGPLTAATQCRGNCRHSYPLHLVSVVHTKSPGGNPHVAHPRTGVSSCHAQR